MAGFRNSGNTPLALLFLRVSAGGMMFFSHGLGKFSSFSERLHKFADPFGLGPEVSFLFTLLAEGICSILVAIGLYTRLATIPLMITMAVAAFIIHAGDPWNKQEFPLLFFIAFTTILIAGPGKYSLDHSMGR
jgi:putative oxidoreductase